MPFQRVAVPARQELWTFQDTMERLLDSYSELARDGRNERLLRDAILGAYRDMPKYHEWSYYKRSSGFSSEAEYTTGTIAYTASTKRFTLSDGTWPANAAFGVVKVGDDYWPAWERVSDTVLEADGDFYPPEDIAAGTSYVWFRDSYPFPALTRKLGRLQSDVNDEVTYVDPEEGLAISRGRYQGPTDRPYFYTVRNDKRYLNSLSIVLIPPPSTAVDYMFLQHPSGQQLTTEKLSTGTATVASSPTTTVTLDSAVLDSALHLGCVLRLSSDGVSEPTSLRGAIGNTNPFAVQRLIVSVDSATEVTVDSAIASDYTDVKYTISSPIDIRYTEMLSCFWSLCEWEYAKAARLEGKEIGQSRHRFYEDLKYAQASDVHSTHSTTAHQTGFAPYAAGYHPYSVGDIL